MNTIRIPTRYKKQISRLTKVERSGILMGLFDLAGGMNLELFDTPAGDLLELIWSECLRMEAKNGKFDQSLVGELLPGNPASNPPSKKPAHVSEKIKPTILSNGTKNFKSNSQINQMIARPLTATMVKMHRACQDNYYSQAFLDAKCQESYLETNFSKDEEAKHKIRKLTPWEALKLQGFDKQFFINANKAGVSNHQLYKQAGNAVSVNTVYTILDYLMTQGK